MVEAEAETGTSPRVIAIVSAAVGANGDPDILLASDFFFAPTGQHPGSEARRMQQLHNAQNVVSGRKVITYSQTKPGKLNLKGMPPPFISSQDFRQLCQQWGVCYTGAVLKWGFVKRGVLLALLIY